MSSKKLILGGALVAAAAAFLFYRQDKKPRAAKSGSAEVSLEENVAFMFIKPHGQSPAMLPFIEKELAAAGISVVRKGDLFGPEIDKRGLIDAHYATIGEYAMKLQPIQLPLSDEVKAAFEKKFGAGFNALANEGRLLNLADTAKSLKIPSADIAKEADAAKGDGLVMKLAPGCYVAYLKARQVYVINGFYGSMRAQYTEPTSKLTWLVVSWKSSKLDWKQFRAAVLGATDPSVAEATSIRAKIRGAPTTLGLDFTPNTSTNCVHGSASPLEGLKERTVWLSTPIQDDSFGKALLAAGFTTNQIAKMLDNPVVGGTPLYDIVEDTTTAECVEKLRELKSNF